MALRLIFLLALLQGHTCLKDSIMSLSPALVSGMWNYQESVGLVAKVWSAHNVGDCISYGSKQRRPPVRFDVEGERQAS